MKSNPICNFYGTDDFKIVWKKFKVIAKRENSSASAKIREYVEGYVKLHDEGNPQLRIDVTLDLEKPYRANRCLDCKKKPRFEGILRGHKVRLCQDDLEKRKKELTGWRELK